VAAILGDLVEKITLSLFRKFGDRWCARISLFRT
jgi:hypothetical protein